MHRLQREGSMSDQQKLRDMFDEIVPLLDEVRISLGALESLAVCALVH
jgi:hypothetical protein